MGRPKEYVEAAGPLMQSKRRCVHGGTVPNTWVFFSVRLGSRSHCRELLDTLDQEGSPFIRKYNYLLAVLPLLFRLLMEHM